LQKKVEALIIARKRGSERERARERESSVAIQLNVHPFIKVLQKCTKKYRKMVG